MYSDRKSVRSACLFCQGLLIKFYIFLNSDLLYSYKINPFFNGRERIYTRR